MENEKLEEVEVVDGVAKVSTTTETSYTKEEVQKEIDGLESEKKSYQTQIDYHQGLIDANDEKIKGWNEILSKIG